jgi:hypothetical protein
LFATPDRFTAGETHHDDTIPQYSRLCLHVSLSGLTPDSPSLSHQFAISVRFISCRTAQNSLPAVSLVRAQQNGH